MSLETAKAEVIAARARAAWHQVKYNEAFEKFQADHADLIALKNWAQECVKEEEEVLRATALEEYAITKDKHPIEGVTIKEMTKLSYDPAYALRWAETHAMFLVLDVKTFEAMAKKMPFDFVQVTKEPQAQLAKELA